MRNVDGIPACRDTLQRLSQGEHAADACHRRGRSKRSRQRLVVPTAALLHSGGHKNNGKTLVTVSNQPKNNRRENDEAETKLGNNHT